MRLILAIQSPVVYFHFITECKVTSHLGGCAPGISCMEHQVKPVTDRCTQTISTKLVGTQANDHNRLNWKQTTK